MTTRVEEHIQVQVPVRTAYDQWTQFEDFPHFMGGVKEVRQLDDRRLHWTAEIAGVRREWEAEVLEQVPDSKVAWAATSGATNAGAVRFEPVGPDATTVYLTLEYEPEGLVEQAGDKLGVVQRQVKSDLERFKRLVEDQGYATGAWRGEIPGSGVGIPDVSAAAASQGDGGKAGISGKIVAGAAAAVGGLAAAAVVASKSGDSDEDRSSREASATPPAAVESATVESATVTATPQVVTPAPSTVADEAGQESTYLDSPAAVVDPDTSSRT